MILRHFDQNWLPLQSNSTGGKDFSKDTQIRMIRSVEPKICTKMLRNLSKNSVREKASPVEDQTLQQKDEKRRRKGQKIMK